MGVESVLVIVGQLNPGLQVLGFLTTMPRKEARWWWGSMDLDQNLFPSTASFGAFFCFHYVRWWWGWTWTRTYSPQQQALVLFLFPLIILRHSIYRCWCHDQWLSSSSQEMAPQFAYNREQKNSPWHVTVDTDKYSLVVIPPSGREPPDVGLTRIR